MKDVWTGQYGAVSQDIKQTQATTTNYVTPYMTPGSTLYKATNFIDTRAGQVAVKGAQSALQDVEKASEWADSHIPKP